MTKVALLLFAAGLVSTPTADLPAPDSEWALAAGDRTYDLVMTPGWSKACLDLSDPSQCVTFTIEAHWEESTCLRYVDSEARAQGRKLAAHVEEQGTPGSPGWRWAFISDEVFEGPWTWHIKTVNNCWTAKSRRLD